MASLPSGMDSSRFIGRRTSLGDAKSRHLASTAGHIGEAGGAEAGKKATKLFTEQVRGENHQQVAGINPAGGRGVRKNLPGGGEAVLVHSPPPLRGKPRFDTRAPEGF